MDKWNEDRDNTEVDEPEDLDSLGDKFGDGKSITVVNIQKLKAPKDLSEMDEMDEMDEDIQDDTSVDLSHLIDKLLRK